MSRGRRDRRGRGLRAPLLSGGTGTAELDRRFGVRPPLPGGRTRAERFDDLLLAAVEELEVRWSQALAGVEFFVEEVPPLPPAAAEGDPPRDPDDELVPLSSQLPPVTGRDAHGPQIIIYRRPVEARSIDEIDKAELVLDLVIHEVAELLGIPLEELDPEGHGGGDEDWD